MHSRISDVHCGVETCQNYEQVSLEGTVYSAAAKIVYIHTSELNVVKSTHDRAQAIPQYKVVAILEVLWHGAFLPIFHSQKSGSPRF